MEEITTDKFAGCANESWCSAACTVCPNAWSESRRQV